MITPPSPYKKESSPLNIALKLIVLGGHAYFIYYLLMRIIEVNNSEVVLQEFKTLRNSIYPYYIALAIVAGLLLISNKIPRAELQKSPYSIVLNWIILGATLTTISYAVARMFYDLGHVFKLI